eukprot:5348667-Pleurochrysis_carterae.AAC.1
MKATTAAAHSGAVAAASATAAASVAGGAHVARPTRVCAARARVPPHVDAVGRVRAQERVEGAAAISSKQLRQQHRRLRATEQGARAASQRA